MSLAGVLACGIVSREAILDQIVPAALLENDPMWECDPVSGNWWRRTLEFFAAQAEARERLPDELDAARIALAGALIALEPLLPPQRDGPAQQLAPNGRLYETIPSWCQGYLPSHRTSGEAIREWRQQMITYAEMQSGGLLWWRCRPEIDVRLPFGETNAGWAVYSRLAIGDPVGEQIMDGRLTPSRHLINDGVTTIEELQALGWSLDRDTDTWTHPRMRYNYGKGGFEPI